MCSQEVTRAIGITGTPQVRLTITQIQLEKKIEINTFGIISSFLFSCFSIFTTSYANIWRLCLQEVTRVIGITGTPQVRWVITHFQLVKKIEINTLASPVYFNFQHFLANVWRLCSQEVTRAIGIAGTTLVR